MEDAEITCDIEKARFLMKIVSESNPKYPPGWIAAAKLEEADGKIEAARVLIQIGCEECPTSEDVWFEACRLAANQNEVKTIIARGVSSSPHSIKLWLALAKLESYENSKNVLNDARMLFPKEPAIWITAAKLEEANGNITKVRKMIERGVRDLQSEGVVIDREAWIEEAEAAERAGAVATCQAIINAIGIVKYWYRGRRRYLGRDRLVC